MTARRKEIYARAAVQLRTHERARRAEKACPGAMGLYLFLLIQARGEATDGDVDEGLAYESWGAPTTYRRKQARALIDAGLVELVEGRLVVIRYGEHNDTREVIAANREKERAKKAAQRSGVPEVVPSRTEGLSPGTAGGTSEGTTRVVPISSSPSDSGLGSREGVQGEVRPPDRWTLDSPLPDTWRRDAEAQVKNTPETVDVRDEWRRYLADRLRPEQPKLVSSADWRGWILRAIGFARTDRQRESDRREKQRRRTAEPERPPPPTPAQSKAFAEELGRRVAARLAAEAAAKASGGGS